MVRNNGVPGPWLQLWIILSGGFYQCNKRAMIACENSGHNSSFDFAKVSRIVETGAASKQCWTMNCLLPDRLKR